MKCVAASYINILFLLLIYSNINYSEFQVIPALPHLTENRIWLLLFTAVFNTLSVLLSFLQMTRFCDISYIFTTFFHNSISQILRGTTEKYFIPTVHGTSSLKLSSGT